MGLVFKLQKISKQIKKGISATQWIEIISKEAGVSKSIVAGRLCNMLKFKNVWKILNQHRPTIKEKVGFV